MQPSQSGEHKLYRLKLTPAYEQGWTQQNLLCEKMNRKDREDRTNPSDTPCLQGVQV